MRKTFKLTVNPAPTPPLSIVTDSPLPDAEVGEAYIETLEATGGDGVYLYSLASGVLPDGLTLSPTGLISGVPTEAGTTSFEVEVVDVPVTQPETDEPVFDAATGTMIYQDDMDGYTTAEEMGALPFGGAARIVPHGSPLTTGTPVGGGSKVVTGRGGSGKALQLRFDGVAQNSAGFLLYQPPTTSNQDTHFFKYWARIDFGDATPFLGNLAVKWFLAWHKNDPGTRMQWNTHNHLPCVQVDGIATFWQVLDKSIETGCQANQPVGPYFKDLQDNGWHRYKYQYKPNSSEGARDGIARMWIDGVKIIDISLAAAGVIPTDSYKSWCELDDLDALATADGIRTVHCGDTQTEPTPPWTLDIDDFQWWTE